MSVGSDTTAGCTGLQMPIVRPAYAQQICNPVLPWCGRPADSLIGAFISNLISVALVIAGLLAFFYLVIGGIQWITSGGDKAGLEAARNRIIHAILGLIIVASTYAIILIVFQFIGLPFPNIPLPRISSGLPAPTP